MVYAVKKSRRQAFWVVLHGLQELICSARCDMSVSEYLSPTPADDGLERRASSAGLLAGPGIYCCRPPKHTDTYI